MEQTNDIETTSEQGPHRLPVVLVLGRPFFLDARLDELRACDNPNDRLPLDASDWLWGD